jgi:polysaccharide export outer membrane protein
MFLLVFNCAWAAEENLPKQNFNLPEAGDNPQQSAESTAGQAGPSPDQLLEVAKESVINFTDMTNYTLGAEDVIQVDVQRHPEFSGIFPVNLDGKIQYKFAGDIEVTGLNKKELEDKIKNTISVYIINPDVTVTILDYKSKVIYVLGEVGQPGKYFMRAESMPVREAAVLAGLPTLSAAMRRCQLITPDKSGKAKIKYVDLYSLLYGGDLTKNIDMHAGDVLYVPATVMAKVMRIISPVTQPVIQAGSAATGTTSTKAAINALPR